MALSLRASPSGSSAACRWKYDVFLSFRGEDTRRGFVSHLYHELQYWHTIRTFKDDRELEIGASISPELLSEIEESHLAVTVLSPNYASSTWCLDELAKIVESMETRNNTILPVFFDVDPSDVRNQRRSFAEAFAKHEERFSADSDILNRWRAALRNVANLSGWNSKSYGCERELIKDIVKCVWRKVHPTMTLLDSADKLVGITFGLAEMSSLLAHEVSDVRFIGIWGMGGMGKTTLAKLVFEKISHHFEVSQFLVNVRDVSARHGTLVDLQKQLLSPILKENITQVWNEEQGTSFIRKCFFNKKVLLVVDNVDHCNELKLLVGNKSWFGEGSRIIITTRDERLLIEHDIELSFKVKQLNEVEALELFCQNAFRRDEPKDDFLKLSKCFVEYAKGLPLALKVLGRSMYKRSQDEWISALDTLQKSPDNEIFSSLKISYDGLPHMTKDIFLDVAFFHKGRNRKQVLHILDKTSGVSSLLGINVLVEKSLLTTTIDEGNNHIIEMHDLIQEMAWEIVRRESPNEPGQRSRLCHRDNVLHVLSSNTGTEVMKGIRLCLSKFEEVDSNDESLSKMHNLTYLEFDNLLISSSPKFLPNSLRSLKWSMYPSKSLPASYIPKLLVKLHMVDSKLVKLWDGKQDLPNLKHMNLNLSKNLIKIPDFTGISNLEELFLSYCSGLVEIHPSIAVHKKIKYLHLNMCRSIESFPSEIDMDSLRSFTIAYCSKVKIPKFARGMKKLSFLDLSGCKFEKGPSTIERLQVGVWNFFGRKSPPQPLDLVLPSIWASSSLNRLCLSNANLCDGDIPVDIGYRLPSLRLLYLRGNNFVSLPSTITCLSKLELIDLSNCERLQQLPVLWARRELLSEDSEPSQLSRPLELNCVNCFGLVNNEGWDNGIFSMLRRLASQGIYSRYVKILSPGNNISKWFNITSEGDSLTVDLPSDQELCGSKWVGVAVGVVFAYQKNQDALESSLISHGIRCSGTAFLLKWLVDGWEEYSIMGDHVAVGFIPRGRIEDSTSCLIHFQCMSWNLESMVPGYSRIPGVKRCGARLVYKIDMEEFLHKTRNMFKRSREYCHDEEDQSGIGNGRSGKELLFKIPKAA